jgi:hypothetical protein
VVLDAQGRVQYARLGVLVDSAAIDSVLQAALGPTTSTLTTQPGGSYAFHSQAGP